MTPLTFLLEGLAAGAVPALLAAGLAVVHRTTGILSFAHGSVGAAGAYAAYAWTSSGGPMVIGGPVAALAGAALCLPLVPFAGRVHRHGAGAAILLTLGWGLLVETGVRASFGSDVKAFLHVFEAEGAIPLPDGGQVPQSSILLLASVLGVCGMGALVLGQSRLGLALRAVGADRSAAASLGLPVGQLEAFAWSVSGAAAGLSGWLLAPRLGLEPQLLWAPMVSGFVAAALGGLDRPAAALAAGLCLGVVERGLVEVFGGSMGVILRWVLLAVALAVVGRRY